MRLVKQTNSVSSVKSYNCKKINQYTLKQLLGNGSIGTVNLCLSNTNNMLYAMKIIKRSKLKTWAKGGTQKIQVNEMEVLKSMVHTNIVKLHEIIDDPLKNKLYLVMDYLPGGSLSEKLRDTTNKLPEEDVRSYFR